jgi:WD40 repeat protein
MLRTIQHPEAGRRRTAGLARLGSAILAAVLLCIASGWPALAQLHGHGGPVRSIAVEPDGGLAISGSFDQSAILWAVETGAALRVLRVHDGAVNAVAAAGSGRFLTGGEDGRIALWRMGAPEPERIFADHDGPVAGLAVSPDGAALASASWDGTVRVRPLAYAVARTNVSPMTTRGGRYAISPSRSRIIPTTRSCERRASSRLLNSVTDTARFGSASSRKA